MATLEKELFEQEAQSLAGKSSNQQKPKASFTAWFGSLILYFFTLSLISGIVFTLWPAVLTAIANVSFTIPLVKVVVDFGFMNTIGLPFATLIAGAVSTVALKITGGILSGLANLVSKRKAPTQELIPSPTVSEDDNKSESDDSDEDDNTLDNGPKKKQVLGSNAHQMVSAAHEQYAIESALLTTFINDNLATALNDETLLQLALDKARDENITTLPTDDIHSLVRKLIQERQALLDDSKPLQKQDSESSVETVNRMVNPSNIPVDSLIRPIDGVPLNSPKNETPVFSIGTPDRKQSKDSANEDDNATIAERTDVPGLK